MPKILLVAATLSLTLALPGAARAQANDAGIAQALLAAPANLAADATVIGFDDQGEIVVIREGSNGLMCWDSSNEPGSQGNWTSQCTSELNRERVRQNHRVSATAGSQEEIDAMFDELEESGDRAVAAYGTMYYHWRGDAASGRSHTNVAVPFATEESSGLPQTPRSDAMWIMDAGTSGAHIMIPGF